MMKENEFRDTLRRFDEFGFFLEALARQHLNDGSGFSAGVVLTLAFEVKAYVREWAGTTPHEPAPSEPLSPGVVEIGAKHRHDYEPSITRGDNPPVCACGQKKNPNGRPRKQQIIMPGAGGSS